MPPPMSRVGRCSHPVRGCRTKLGVDARDGGNFQRPSRLPRTRDHGVRSRAPARGRLCDFHTAEGVPTASSRSGSRRRALPKRLRRTTPEHVGRLPMSIPSTGAGWALGRRGKVSRRTRCTRSSGEDPNVEQRIPRRSDDRRARRRRRARRVRQRLVVDQLGVGVELVDLPGQRARQAGRGAGPRGRQVEGHAHGRRRRELPAERVHRLRRQDRRGHGRRPRQGARRRHGPEGQGGQRDVRRRSSRASRRRSTTSACRRSPTPRSARRRSTS